MILLVYGLKKNEPIYKENILVVARCMGKKVGELGKESLKVKLYSYKLNHEDVTYIMAATVNYPVLHI